MQIFSHVLAVPGVAAKTQNEGLRPGRRIGGDVNPGELVSFRSFKREPLRALRQRSSRGNGMDRKDQLRLKLEHGGRGKALRRESSLPPRQQTPLLSPE